MKYAHKCLRKGKRVIHVLFYIAPGDDSHKCPCGSRHGRYACEVDGKTKFILTPNVSRYVTSWNWTIEDEIDECGLHAHHTMKHQENCTEHTEGMWKRFYNFIFK